MKNDDQECLKWALLSILEPVRENPHRKSKYEDLSSNHSLHGHVGCETLKHYQLQSDLSFTRA